MQYSIYHMTLKSHFIRLSEFCNKNAAISALENVTFYGRQRITLQRNLRI